MNYNKEKFELYLFDMDGVIIDSRKLYIKALKKVLSNFQVNAEEEVIFKNMGDIVENFFRNFLPENKINTASKMLDNCLINISDEYAKIIPGTKEVLKELAKKNKICLVTNSNYKFVYYNFKRFKIFDFFYEIMSGDHMLSKKELRCLKLIKELNIKTNKTIFIGDLLSDINTAKNVGCHSCLVYNKYSWLYPHEEKINSKEIDIIINDIRKLIY